MTLLATSPSSPVQGPNRPWPNPSTPPQLRTSPWPYPNPDPTGDPSQPDPTPRVALRIGNPPRMSRRQRAIRVFEACGNYALAWAVLTGAAWLALFGLWVAAFAVLYLASVLCSPWRPKKSRTTESVCFARRRGAGANPRPWRSALSRRSGLPPTRARAA